MAHQETMNGADASARRFGRNLSGFAHDVATLAELQFRLLAVDLRDAKKAAGLAVMLMAAGLVLAFGMIPILLAALAYVLVDFAGWPLSAAFGVVALGAVVLAAGMAFVGWKRLTRGTATLNRSRRELKETFHWIKESLRPGDELSPANSDRYAASPPRW
ncbi:MAG: phage holin family protein [Planctomyces sp.]|nr:phage holin family protein [Planctomyces sp.]